jgi:hypothetical protein
MKNFQILYSITIFFLFGFPSTAQIQPVLVQGIVLDSATQKPQPYTAIQIKGKGFGASSLEDGSFSFQCGRGDTLIFTRLGYHSFFHIASREELALKIGLIEIGLMLKGVTVYDKIIIPGIDDWKKDVKAHKRTEFIIKSPTDNEPGTVPVFGPGMIIRFGGKDKTKKKRDDLVKTSVYRATVNSPEVKKQLIELYSISEETFYRKLEKFNKENPQAAYLTRRDDIVTMLIYFFALKEP